MDRSLTLQLLNQYKPVLSRRFGVVELALFGSSARDETHVDSDVDMLLRPELRPFIEREVIRA